MSGFVFHPAAVTDLTEIWEYIATDIEAPLKISHGKQKANKLYLTVPTIKGNIAAGVFFFG